MLRIGIIEDDPIMGESLVQRLRLEGYDPLWWQSGGEALEAMNDTMPDMLICDIRLPDMDGEEVFEKLGARVDAVPVLFVTAFGDIEQAVRLMRKGADEYILKPFEFDEFLRRIDRLFKERGGRDAAEMISRDTLGISAKIREIEATLHRIADIDTNVLLTGESGTGKEVAARFLHDMSSRRAAPFITVNCAAIPGELMESELFGHERGAFTGAQGRHLGYAERVGEGTLFLDEIGDLPLHLQGKLLHLIQERAFTRVGGETVMPFRARIVSATNRDLRRAIAEGKFRDDLYYRINVIPVHIPPLRERREDILPLIRGYIDFFAGQFGRPALSLSPAAAEAVENYDWPGNIRELRNRVERAVALADGPVLRAQSIFPDVDETDPDDEIPTLRQVREASERRHIIRVLEKTEGHIGAAAEILGISRTTLWEKMKAFSITPRP